MISAIEHRSLISWMFWADGLRKIGMRTLSLVLASLSVLSISFSFRNILIVPCTSLLGIATPAVFLKYYSNSDASFRCLFTTGSGWGAFSQRVQGVEAAGAIELVGGSLALKEFGFGRDAPGGPPLTALVNRAPVAARLGDAGIVVFDAPVQLKAGDKLEVRLRRKV